MCLCSTLYLRSLPVSRSVYAGLQTFSVFLPSHGRVPVPSTHTAENAIIHLPVASSATELGPMSAIPEITTFSIAIRLCSALTAKTHVRNQANTHQRDRRRDVQRSFSWDRPPGLNPYSTTPRRFCAGIMGGDCASHVFASLPGLAHLVATARGHPGPQVASRCYRSRRPCRRQPS